MYRDIVGSFLHDRHPRRRRRCRFARSVTYRARKKTQYVVENEREQPNTSAVRVLQVLLQAPVRRPLTRTTVVQGISNSSSTDVFRFADIPRIFYGRVLRRIPRAPKLHFRRGNSRPLSLFSFFSLLPLLFLFLSFPSSLSLLIAAK